MKFNAYMAQKKPTRIKAKKQEVEDGKRTKHKAA